MSLTMTVLHGVLGALAAFGWWVLVDRVFAHYRNRGRR